MTKTEVQAILKVFKEHKDAAYLCSNNITREFYRSNKNELGAFAKEYLKKTYFKNYYTVEPAFTFLFYCEAPDLSYHQIRHVRVKFLEWLIRTKL